MKRIFVLLAAVSLFMAACSKKDDAAEPKTTSAKFRIEFPSAYLHIDSIQVSYKDATGTLVNNTVTGVSTWESPAISYAAGKNAYAAVRAYGTTLSSSSFTYPSLYLVKTGDNTVIEATGSNTISSNIYRFAGEISHDF